MKRVYVREEACVGCGLCKVYCATLHSDFPSSVFKAFTLSEETPIPRIVVERKGLASFAWQCRHCEDAPCVSACITGAMHKNDQGVVLVDEEKCIGCSTCIVACPFGAILEADKRQVLVLKCDLCTDLCSALTIGIRPDKKLIMEGDQIIGFVFIGDIARCGIYRFLIEKQINTAAFRERLLSDDFGMIDLPTAFRLSETSDKEVV